jgi:hypothetical protein
MCYNFGFWVLGFLVLTDQKERQQGFGFWLSFYEPPSPIYPTLPQVILVNAQQKLLGCLGDSKITASLW